ncbi:ZIP family metal transporter [Lampropedia aestuarii]|uniref:ZIP family metal transporter n=1 Tax=Lampropedia aestuarii TaxID=2562762 RepID=A0A4S5BNH6_9BURK|nr:ZIP family metal transporter [Lampropedia aestuarii]MDH5858549.1 ZIP family metal transporter [Lampropedia aestuarii]THJ33980.1 ZIP family metal transporter [Lampropedia aestuarii]
MTLGLILLATLLAGVGSVWVAASLIRLGVGKTSSRIQEHHLLSFAAGALLATAFVHLLPEAMEMQTVSAHSLFAVLLGGLVVFFLLDKAEIWHHGHEHGDSHDHHHGHGHGHSPAASHAHHHHSHPPQTGTWSILAGDSVHCFGDGILIASAFLVDWRLGLIAALSVLAHEVPHHMGDLAVLMGRANHKELAAGTTGARPPQTAAIVKLSIAGAVTMLGGLLGYLLLSLLSDSLLPYFLVVAASSFVYVALADLIPQLQMKLSGKQTAIQVAWLLAGMALVALVSSTLHHEHDGHAGHDHAHGSAAKATDLGSFRQHPLNIDNMRSPAQSMPRQNGL